FENTAIWRHRKGDAAFCEYYFNLKVDAGQLIQRLGGKALYPRDINGVRGTGRFNCAEQSFRSTAVDEQPFGVLLREKGQIEWFVVFVTWPDRHALTVGAHFVHESHGRTGVAQINEFPIATRFGCCGDHRLDRSDADSASYKDIAARRLEGKVVAGPTHSEPVACLYRVVQKDGSTSTLRLT